MRSLFIVWIFCLFYGCGSQEEVEKKLSMRSQEEAEDYWLEMRILANASLKKEVEDVYSEESVPEELIREAYDKFAFGSGKPELVTASHLLLRVYPKDSAERKARLYQMASEIRASLKYDESLGDEILLLPAKDLIEAGVSIALDRDMKFPIKAIEPFMGVGYYYHGMVDAFAKAAFALDENQRISPVVETEFGYHIIYLQSRSMEERIPYEEIRPYLVSQIVKRARELAVDELLNKLLASSEIENF